MTEDQLVKECVSCLTEKPLDEFYFRTDANCYRSKCKICFNKQNTQRVAEWRRGAKLRLVTEFGGSCADCGYVGPPFMFDFDHRDPELKEFGLSKSGKILSYARLKAEAEKCDLVCANCHRFRTHKQRCSGCQYCKED